MNIQEFTDVLKCINDGNACAPQPSDILTPSQLDAFIRSSIPSTNTGSIKDLDKLRENVKKLGSQKKYCNWNDIKYYLLFSKSDSAYIVFALGAQREIIARLDDYCQKIEKNSEQSEPIKEVIIIEA